MKIIYIHQYFNTPSMSGGTRSYEFAKRLVSMGHEVNIVTSCREKNNNKYIFSIEEGIKIHWIPIYYSNYLNFSSRIISFLKFAWLSYFKAKNFEADLIFASSTPLTVSIPGILLSKKKKIPLVFEVRDLWPSVPIALKVLKNYFICLLAKYMENFVYKYSKGIIVLSPTMKSNIIYNNKISSSKIAVIPNSCDLKEFKYSLKLDRNFRKKRHWLGNKPLLLYAGTFGKVNNLEYAVNLAFVLNKINSNIKILLVGDGIEKNKLIEISKKKKVFQNNIFIEEPVSKYQMREYLSAATMCANFVIDVKETWSNSANKFFDTLAAEKPIFLNHGGWMEDLVFSNKFGMCAYGKPMYIVAKELDNLMNDKKWLKKSGKISKKIAKSYFNRDLHASQLEKILLIIKKKQSKSIEKIAPGVYK